MFKKALFSFIVFSLLLVSSAYAGKVELTTYYPAPSGEYITLSTTGNANFATSTDHTNYFGVTIGEGTSIAENEKLKISLHNDDWGLALYYAPTGRSDSSGVHSLAGGIHVNGGNLTLQKSEGPYMFLRDDGIVAFQTNNPTRKDLRVVIDPQKTPSYYAGATAGEKLPTFKVRGNMEISVDDEDNMLRFHDPNTNGVGGYWWCMGIDRSNDGNFKINRGGTWNATTFPTAGTLGAIDLATGYAFNDFTIDNYGRVGIQTDNPKAQLHIANDALLLSSPNTTAATPGSGYGHYIWHDKNNNDLRFMVSGGARGSYDRTTPSTAIAKITAGGVWEGGSSIQYKTDIRTLSMNETLDTVMNLRPIEYRAKADHSERQLGFIAEDVPDLVANKDRKGLSPMNIAAVLTKVVQEQQKDIASLKQELRAQADSFRKEISTIKKQLAAQR